MDAVRPAPWPTLLDWSCVRVAERRPSPLLTSPAPSPAPTIPSTPASPGTTAIHLREQRTAPRTPPRSSTGRTGSSSPSAAPNASPGCTPSPASTSRSLPDGASRGEPEPRRQRPRRAPLRADRSRRRHLDRHRGRATDPTCCRSCRRWCSGPRPSPVTATSMAVLSVLGPDAAGRILDALGVVAPAESTRAVARARRRLRPPHAVARPSDAFDLLVPRDRTRAAGGATLTAAGAAPAGSVGVRGTAGGRSAPPDRPRHRRAHHPARGPLDRRRRRARRGPPGEGLLPRPGDGGPGAQPRQAAASPRAAAPRRRPRTPGRSRATRSPRTAARVGTDRHRRRPPRARTHRAGPGQADRAGRHRAASPARAPRRSTPTPCPATTPSRRAAPPSTGCAAGERAARRRGAAVCVLHAERDSGTQRVAAHRDRQAARRRPGARSRPPGWTATTSATPSTTAARSRRSTPTSEDEAQRWASELGRELPAGWFGENLRLERDRRDRRGDRRALARSATRRRTGGDRPADPVRHLRRLGRRAPLGQAVHRTRRHRRLPAGGDARASVTAGDTVQRVHVPGPRRHRARPVHRPRPRTVWSRCSNSSQTCRRPSRTRPVDGSPDWKVQVHVLSVELVEVVRSGFRECVHRGSVVSLAPGRRDRARPRRGAHADLPAFVEQADAGRGPAAATASPRPDRASWRSRPRPTRASRDHVEVVDRLLARYGLDEDQLAVPAESAVQRTRPGPSCWPPASCRAGST